VSAPRLKIKSTLKDVKVATVDGGLGLAVGSRRFLFCIGRAALTAKSVETATTFRDEPPGDEPKEPSVILVEEETLFQEIGIGMGRIPSGRHGSHHLGHERVVDLRN
jgi:hypothetical protein